MNDIYKIIKTVSVTEKSNLLMEDNKYTFSVDNNAKKHDIKRAVQELFERKVKNVNVMNYAGKTKRNKFGLGKKADWKKAVITLEDGEEAIDLF